jgi:ketosteroid isomerase-like protein
VKTEEIKQAYEYWKSAVINGDLASLDKICAENFVWTNEMGITNNKTENLYKIASDNLKYLSWISEYVTIKMLGDIAILKTREILKVIVYKQRVNAVQDVTAIFINEDGKWLLAGGQETSSSLN